MAGDTIWITGATGLLGRALFQEFRENFGGTTLGTGFSRASGDIRNLDLLDEKLAEAFINEHQPGYILHSAAERRPDISESDPEKTDRLNVDATRCLAKLAKETGAWILYISTDYVFDGTKPPYQAGDIPNPLNHYGKSKLEGENVIRDTTDNYAILRVPILYGSVESLEESAVTQIATQLRQDPIPPIENWATRYPTHVDDVALVCRQMVEYRADEEGFRGIFQWSGNEPFTKYEMARLMAPALDIDPSDIPSGPDQNVGTPRPQDCCLDTTGLESLGFGAQRDFADAIQGILSALQTG